MARTTNVCVVPRCGRHVVPEEDDHYPQGIISRQLCSRCYGSRGYWRKREREQPGSVKERQLRLKFFNDRLGWLYESGDIDE